jgi:hypothetical protein
MPEPAFLLMTVSRVIPEQVWDAVQILHAHLPQAGLPGIHGPHQSLLIESQEEPGRLTWLTTWDTKGDSQAFLSSTRYTDLIAAWQPYLLRQPEWYWYIVLEDWAQEIEPVKL